MSDHKSFSSIDLFKTPAPSSGPGMASAGEIGKRDSSDMSFSRELSRATDRAVPAEKSPSSSRHDNTNATNQKSTSRSHENQRADSHSSSQRAAQGSSESDGSSQDSDRQRVNSSENTNKSRSQSESADSARETSKADSQRAETVTGEGADVDSAGLQASKKQESTFDEDAVLQEAVISDQYNAQADQLTDVKLTDSTDDSSTEEITDADPERLSSSGIATTNTTDSITAVKENGLEAGNPATQRIVAGEQLSPRELANRQALLLNNTAGSELGSATKMNQRVNEEIGNAEKTGLTSRSATVSSIAASSLVESQRQKDQKLAGNNVQIIYSATAKPTAAKVISGESVNVLLDAKGIQAADVESEANLAAALRVQKSEQANLQTNLTQSLQLAQQQSQSLNLATAAISAEPADKAGQSLDNTFLSLQGGIVTAPTVTKPDAGFNQTINAPINMPILQNDADKAMAGNIRWMVNEGVKNAVVNVTPSGMGPISVTIGMEKDQMNVSIVALQGSTREALDSMLPRLREQLASQGHDSVRVDISDGQNEQSARGYGQHFNDEQNSDNQMSGNEIVDDESDDGSMVGTETVSDRSPGLVTTINDYGQIRSSYDIYV